VTTALVLEDGAPDQLSFDVLKNVWATALSWQLPFPDIEVAQEIWTPMLSEISA
jgi:hypothetical protein